MAFIWNHETFRHADLRIRFHSLKIVEAFQLPSTEREEIASDLWTHLLVQAEKYDPGLSAPHTFISRVVLNKARDIFRAWWKGKSKRRRYTVSLNGADSSDEDRRRAMVDRLAELDYKRSAYGDHATAIERLDRQIDVARQMARLSEVQRGLCLRLLSESISAIARSSGVSRHEISSQIREIREVLRDVE